MRTHDGELDDALTIDSQSMLKTYCILVGIVLGIGLWLSGLTAYLVATFFSDRIGTTIYLSMSALGVVVFVVSGYFLCRRDIFVVFGPLLVNTLLWTVAVCAWPLFVLAICCQPGILIWCFVV